MTQHDGRWMYRQMIDAMVVSCSSSGQVSAERIRAGVWNTNAAEVADSQPHQLTMNEILAALEPDQRHALAVLFAEEFSSGVYNALGVLTAADCEPFTQGYDGEPGDDFLGRLDGWEWPVS